MDRGVGIILIAILFIVLAVYDGVIAVKRPGAAGSQYTSGENPTGDLVRQAVDSVPSAPAGGTTINVSYGGGGSGSPSPPTVLAGYGGVAQAYTGTAGYPSTPGIGGPIGRPGAPGSALATSVSQLETCHGFWDCAGKTVVAGGTGFLSFIGL